MRNHLIGVLVADDDPGIRDALADLIDSHPALELLGTASDHAELVRLSTELRPDVVITDVQMPEGDAQDSIRTIRERSPQTGVVALSAYADRDAVIRMLAAGAAAYLVKGAPAEEILEAIIRAARGQFSMGQELAADLAELLKQAAHVAWRSEDWLNGRLEGSILQLLDRVPCAALLVGGWGLIEYANVRAQRSFGYSSTGLRGRPLTDLVPERLRATAEQLLERPFVAPTEITGHRRDGSEFPLQVTAGHLQGADHRTVVFFLDLSEIRAAEDRFRELVESSVDAMIILSSSGQVQVANSQAESVFGYDRGQMTGLPGEVLLSGPDWAETPEEPSERSLELVGHRRDSSQFPAEVAINPLHTEDDLLSVLTVTDLTQIQRAQVALERSLEVLEITDRDRQTLLGHLVRAQEEERGRMAADIHDDTIQVITAVSLRLQQFRRRLEDPEQLEVLDKLEDTLKEAIGRLRQLIFDLRPPSLEYGSLAGALRTVLEQLRDESGTKYRLEDRLGANPPAETAVLMYRTAQEALMNVRKHARANTVHVQLLGLDEGCLVRIVDDGVGYDPLEVESRPGHLGLTLIQERAQIAGGWCRIESAPGAGTTVEFWVPLTESTRRDCNVAARERRSTEQPAGDAPGFTGDEP